MECRGVGGLAVEEGHLVEPRRRLVGRRRQWVAPGGGGCGNGGGGGGWGCAERAPRVPRVRDGQGEAHGVHERPNRCDCKAGTRGFAVA